VPQIWIGEAHIGGYDDMRALDARGELEPLIAAAGLR
jgi:glutaredoxin 3